MQEGKEKSKKVLKTLDLFSGGGGFALGLDSTGYFKTIAFAENNPDCHLRLNKNFPQIPIIEDVKKVSGKIYKDKIDVICGGFPCQDASTANTKGKGIKGERTGLWKEYKRIIKEIRPKYVIAENVPNLRNRGLGEVIQDLREIGYMGRADIISARAFGALHPRERLFIIATNSDNYGLINEAIASSTKDSKEQWENNRRAKSPFIIGAKWATEPNVDRVVHGVPYELDFNRRKRKEDSKTQKAIKRLIKETDEERAKRIKILGNAVYVPIIKWLGNIIGEYENRK